MVIWAKKFGAATLVGALGLLAIATYAWACSAQSRLFGISPLAGPPRTSVTMRGEAVAPGTMVEIRWNSPNGEKLGGTQAGADGRFAVVVQIPEAAPDVYYLLAVPADKGTSLARNAFEVTETTGIAGSNLPTEGQGHGRNVTSDLWAALSAQSSGTTDPGVVSAPSDEGRPSGMATGLGLMAVGIVALGFTAAAGVLRKRRAG